MAARAPLPTSALRQQAPPPVTTTAAPPAESMSSSDDTFFDTMDPDAVEVSVQPSRTYMSPAWRVPEQDVADVSIPPGLPPLPRGRAPAAALARSKGSVVGYPP